MKSVGYENIWLRNTVVHRQRQILWQYIILILAQEIIVCSIKLVFHDLVFQDIFIAALSSIIVYSERFLIVTAKRCKLSCFRLFYPTAKEGD